MHVSAVTLANDLIQNFWFVSSFAIITQIIDKRIAGIHITLLASLTNFCQFSHKFYIFWLVEQFGIFVPQYVIATLGICVCIYFRKTIMELDDVPRKSWLVSDKIIYMYESKSKTN